MGKALELRFYKSACTKKFTGICYCIVNKVNQDAIRYESIIVEKKPHIYNT